MVYGQFQYGSLQYGTQDENISPEPQGRDLMGYLPPYWHEVMEMQKLQATVGIEVEALQQAAEEILQQMFVTTATYGLDLWEKELRITTDRSKPYVRRREIIQAKLRGTGTVTKQMIQNVAIAFSGGEVDIIEYPGEYRFAIQFIGVLGIPSNMAGLIHAIEEIKPAHLEYSFIYTYTAWNMLFDLTWGQAGTRTWNQLKKYEGA